MSDWTDDIEPVEFIVDGWCKFADLLQPNKWGKYTLVFHPDDDTTVDEIVRLTEEWGVTKSSHLSDWDDLRLKSQRMPKLSAQWGVRQHEENFVYWDSYARIRAYAYPEMSYYHDVYMSLYLDAVHLISNDPYSLAREEERRREWWRFLR